MLPSVLRYYSRGGDLTGALRALEFQFAHANMSPPGHASFHGRTTSSAIEASMLQARACGTVYRRTCDQTRTLRVSSVN